MTDPIEQREDPRLSRTRSRVLEATREALLELGFTEAVTIEEISNRSGVARSTLYRHWRTREEILRDAFSQIAVVPTTAGADLAEELRHYASVFAEGLQTTWGRAAATLAMTALDDPQQQEVLRTFVDGYTRDVDQLVRRAIDRGERVRADYEAATIADDLLAALYNRHLFRRQPIDSAFVAAQVDRVIASLSIR